MSGLQGTVAKISDPADVFGGQSAAAGIESSERLGQQSMAMQQEWMNYLKSQYEPYSAVATDALSAQVGLSGLGGDEAKQQMIQDIQKDPLYRAKLAAGDDAVLRNQSATGGLRSGNTQSALAVQNQGMLSTEIDNRYNLLAGLSGQGFQGQQAMSAYGGQTIDQMSTTLGTMASGQIAAGAASAQRGSGLLGGLIGGAASMFSDRRLKKSVTKVGTKHGLNWYSWVWNERAEKELGLFGSAEGHMADEVKAVQPELVIEHNGYETVNYGGF
jgi:hypothetical protein